MKTFIFIKEFNGCPEGTKLFLQDGMYFYKTPTEDEKWLDVEFVERSSEYFRQQTLLEAIFHCQEIKK